MDYLYWENHKFSTGANTGEDYIAFQREMKADLKKLIEPFGFEIYQFYNNHYCFSAIIVDADGNFIYISFSNVRGHEHSNKGLFGETLIRKMSHGRDFAGGPNNYCHWTQVGEIAKELIK